MSVRLRGMDGAFFAAEAEGLPMHTLKVLVLDKEATPASRAELLSKLRPIVARLPCLKRRVVPSVGNLAQPSWEETELSWEHHLDRIRVQPVPGALEKAVSRIAAWPLNLSRPPWHVTWVVGLPRGRSALVCRVHHGLADGGAASQALEIAFGEGEAPPLETKPTKRQPLLAGLQLLIRLVARLPRAALRAAWARLRVWRRRRTEPAAAAPYDGTTTQFNRAVDGTRIFACTRMPVDAIKAVAERADVTFNDILLSVCCGGLRSYLQHAESLPGGGLIASVPSALEDRPSNAAMGNYVSSLFAELPVHVESVVRRVKAIRRSTKAAKAEAQLSNVDEEALMNALPPALLKFGLWVARCIKPVSRFRPQINLVVSNVRGPAERLQAHGLGVAALYSVGPLMEKAGLNITAWSYRGKVHVGLLACRTHVPDLEKLARALPSALEELDAAF